MIFSNFFDTKGRMLTVLKFASLSGSNFSKTGVMSESFNVSRSSFMSWAKNWKVPIWFKRKKKIFGDFRVFDFALHLRSKNRKSRKFCLPQILTLVVTEDFKTPEKWTETKAKRLRYDLEPNWKFWRFPSFRFRPTP